MIQNREKFLEKIATSLNRPFSPTQKPVRNWQHKPEEKKLSHLSIDELMSAFVEQCGRLNNTNVVEVSSGDVKKAVDEAVKQHGGESVALWNDERFRALGLEELYENEWADEGLRVHVWDSNLSRTENFERTNDSNIGIVFAEYALAESGTVVLYSAEGQGKAVGLLPNAFIAIVKKSTLRPRITQAVQEMEREFVEAGKTLPAAVDFVSGPSNSADIEMDLVVGVHGPIYATYIVVSDQ
ncbi:lactate utilization protein C [Kurthia gibsonii]|uniref:LutC/YkgG family protein n=1 Tax=Kurthia gibsonii TaxID=33946 RepID=UPI003F22B9CD